MKIRAAVLEEFGAPLEVQGSSSRSRTPARCSSASSPAASATPISTPPPPGRTRRSYAPTVLGHEGAGVVERVGDGVDSVAPGDHVVTLFAPQCRECVLPSPRHQPLPRDPGGAGQGPPAGRHDPPPRDGEPIRHFMGTSTFAEYTVMPEIALAKVSPEAPLDGAALFACGLSTGLGAAMKTAAVEPDRPAPSSAPAWSASAPSPAAASRAPSGSSASTSPRSGSSSPRARARPRRCSAADAVERILDATGGFGADYTFEATGNVGVMRQAVESARMGWGLCTVAGVAGKGETLEIVPRFLITGRRVAGSSFGGIKGRARCRSSSSAARRRDRRRPVPVAQPHTRRGQPWLRADGGAGRHPQRDPVRLGALARDIPSGDALAPPADPRRISPRARADRGRRRPRRSRAPAPERWIVFSAHPNGAAGPLQLIRVRVNGTGPSDPPVRSRRSSRTSRPTASRSCSRGSAPGSSG